MQTKATREEFDDAGLIYQRSKDTISLDIKKICKSLNKMTYGFSNLLIRLLNSQPPDNITDYMHTLKLYYGKNRLTGREFASLANLIFPRINFTKDNIERYGNYEYYFYNLNDDFDIPCPF